MDFIILKVNGQDLSTASHQQILEVLNSAPEPIYVEVARRYSKPNPPVKKSVSHMMDLSINIPTNGEYILPYASAIIQSPLHSYASPLRSYNDSNQGLSLNSQKSISPDSNKIKDLFSTGEFLKIDGILEEGTEIDDDDDEQVEIIKEEVVLRKQQLHEIFGLTLSYSALSASDNSESEVYISAIEPNSVAKKEPNIHLGDQILQINNVNVHSKAQVVSLFQKCGLEVRLLLGRPNVIPKTNGHINKNGSYNLELPPLEEVEYASVYDEVEATSNKESQFNHLDKDSGIGRGTDEAAKTEESSECDSNQTSLRKFVQYESFGNSDIPSDPAYIAELMQHLALEYQHLQKLLQDSSEFSKITPLPPPALFQNSSRIVPRMGTKLEPAQVKSAACIQPASSSNTSTNSTGVDSTCSSPFTVESGSNFNSASYLSLKIDVSNNNSKFMDFNYNMSAYRVKSNLSSNSDQKSTSGSSTNNVSDSRMISSTLMHPFDSTNSVVCQRQSDDSECHYYDVYDPLTKSFNELSKPSSRCNSQNEHQNFVDDHEYINAHLVKCDKFDNKMEWVVKKRPDGTRYITRRPVRNKLLKEREKRLNEERNYTTEEEDNHTDFMLNRYWTKSDKKKYYDKMKDKKSKKKNNSSFQQSCSGFNNSGFSRNDLFTNQSALKDILNENFNSENCDIATTSFGSTLF